MCSPDGEPTTLMSDSCASSFAIGDSCSITPDVCGVECGRQPLPEQPPCLVCHSADQIGMTAIRHHLPEKHPTRGDLLHEVFYKRQRSNTAQFQEQLAQLAALCTHLVDRHIDLWHCGRQSAGSECGTYTRHGKSMQSSASLQKHAVNSIPA